jgi:hypothetical protein
MSMRMTMARGSERLSTDDRELGLSGTVAPSSARFEL